MAGKKSTRSKRSIPDNSRILLTSYRSAAKVVRAPREASTEQIARRAYELWERRGRVHGHDREDWLIAESELMNGL